ncbi:MAG: hypothetical protein M1823_008350, partial [Watsoniomyces obsoletus]
MKAPPKKATREPSPELEATTTSAFFATSNKPKRTEPVKRKSADAPKATPKKSATRAPKTATAASSGRSLGRAKRPITSYADRDDDDEFPSDDLDDADDIFQEQVTGKLQDDYVEIAGSDNDLAVELPHRGTPRTSTKKQKRVSEEPESD